MQSWGGGRVVHGAEGGGGAHGVGVVRAVQGHVGAVPEVEVVVVSDRGLPEKQNKLVKIIMENKQSVHKNEEQGGTTHLLPYLVSLARDLRKARCFSSRE